MQTATSNSNEVKRLKPMNPFRFRKISIFEVLKHAAYIFFGLISVELMKYTKDINTVWYYMAVCGMFLSFGLAVYPSLVSKDYGKTEKFFMCVCYAIILFIIFYISFMA